MGLGWAFEVLEQEIRGFPGTPAEGALIIFRGMQAYNAENIKSLEDFDIAWVEEAQALSERSLRLLAPDHPQSRLRALVLVEPAL
jgi:phage terminase large subunit